jgi:hypothetical protein
MRKSKERKIQLGLGSEFTTSFNVIPARIGEERETMRRN